MEIVEQYFLQLNTKKQRFRRSVICLTALSLLVMLTVSWNLRQTGIAYANGASCGIEEHRHSDECVLEKILICGMDSEGVSQLSTESPTEPPTQMPTEAPTEPPTQTITEAPTEAPMEAYEETAVEDILIAAADVLSVIVPAVHAAEIPEEDPTEEIASAHTHTDACYEVTYQCGLEAHTHDFSCYCDETADLENWDIWSASVPELTGQVSEDIVLVAQSQIGCTESTLNFKLADDGETRNGITRYGQWYGNPYGAWSNMFTSFCLRFAGLDSVPVNSGAEKMMKEWE